MFIHSIFGYCHKWPSYGSLKFPLWETNETWYSPYRPPTPQSITLPDFKPSALSNAPGLGKPIEKSPLYTAKVDFGGAQIKKRGWLQHSQFGDRAPARPRLWSLYDTKPICKVWGGNWKIVSSVLNIFIYIWLYIASCLRKWKVCSKTKYS